MVCSLFVQARSACVYGGGGVAPTCLETSPPPKVGGASAPIGAMRGGEVARLGGSMKVHVSTRLSLHFLYISAILHDTKNILRLCNFSANIILDI